MNVVLDTNAIVSGIINQNGFPAKLLNMVINGKLTINADTRIILEYDRVLRSPKFLFPEENVESLLKFLSHESKLVLPNPLLMTLPDPSDRPFIEVSLHENIPLITGNKKHFNGIEKLMLYSPKEFFE
ncbi:MAG: putative toxin-antitoxin system toxin component, PIN family [bacterium]